MYIQAAAMAAISPARAPPDSAGLFHLDICGTPLLRDFRELSAGGDEDTTKTIETAQ